MPNGKYQKWLEPENLLLLKSWAMNGLTDEQIANNMGINVATLYRYKKNFCEICESLKKGKEIADIQVENALYNLALSGNVTAIIFWLKNRMPHKWKDKPTTENSEILEKLDNVINNIDSIAIYSEK